MKNQSRRREVTMKFSIDLSGINRAIAYLNSAFTGVKVELPKVQISQESLDRLSRSYRVFMSGVAALNLQDVTHLKETFRNCGVSSEEALAGFRTIYKPLQPENDLCKFDARSPYLQCAANPAGDCAECPHFEKV